MVQIKHFLVKTSIVVLSNLVLLNCNFYYYYPGKNNVIAVIIIINPVDANDYLKKLNVIIN